MGGSFVGRKEIFQAIETGPSSGFYRFIGIAGSGKSKLLLKINHKLRDRGLTVVHLSGSRAPVISAAAEADPVLEARVVLQQCASIALLIEEDLTRHQRSQMHFRCKETAQKIGEAHRRALRLSDLAPEHRPAAGLPVSTNAGLDATSATLEWLEQVRLDFGARVANALGTLQPAMVSPVVDSRAGLVVLVDEFDVLAGTRVGDWLVALLKHLDRSVRVLAGRPIPALREPHDPVLAALPVHRLAQFSRSEVDQYLHKKLPAVTTENLLDDVLRVTSGHPILVGIAADLIETYGPDTDLPGQFGYSGAELVDRIAAEADLDRLCDSLAALLEQLLEPLWTSRDRAGVEPTVGLLDRLCTVPSFNATILEVLLGDFLPATERAVRRRLLQRLMRLSFAVGFDDDDDAGHRIHALVHARRLSQLQRCDPTRLQPLHRRFEEHYHTQLNDFAQTWENELEIQEKARWRKWHRYEDPRWPNLVNIWLYHLARAGEDPAAVRVAFCRLFFDAFWWLGEAVPFGFCDQVLSASATPGVGGREASSEDGEWLQQLWEFYRTYPRGFLPDHTDPTLWERTGAALAYLGDHLPAGTDFTDQQWHDLLQCRGLISLYRGYAARFSGAPLEQVEHPYGDALLAFHEVKDEWCALWVKFEHADALRARGWNDRALALVPHLQEEIEEQQEYELRVHLAIMLGNIRWTQRDYGKAMDAYARALAHAYVYQVRQETDDQAPSEYTQGLYSFVLDVVEGHLRLLLEQGGEASLTGAAAQERLRVFFAPAVPTPTAAEITAGPDRDGSTATYLPLPPSVLDFTTTNTPYADNVRNFLKQRRGELDETGIDRPLEGD